MYKLLFSILLSTMIYGSSSAQAFKVNPFSLLGGSNLVGIEFPVRASNSVQLNINYIGVKKDDNKFSSFGVGVEYRFYFGEQMNSWYVTPAIDFASGRNTVNDTLLGEVADIKFNSFGGDIRGGRQWIFSSGFLLDLNATVGYAPFNYKYADAIEEKLFEDTVIKGGLRYGITLGLGFAFGSKK